MLLVHILVIILEMDKGLKSNDDNITIRSFSGARIRAKAERVYRK